MGIDVKIHLLISILTVVILASSLGIHCQEEEVQLVPGGTIANMTQYPYHVVIFEKVDSPKEYTQICGGTLISAKFVVSAAHCFWDEEQSLQKSSDLYKIRAGNPHRSWSRRTNPLSVQEREVANISLPRRYLGGAMSYENDVAVISLREELLVTEFVGVADVDWHDLWTAGQLVNTSQGVVAGWGGSHNTGNESAVLKVVSLPFVDPDTCFDSLEFYLKQFLTHDKFCAGFTNRSVTVCRGDSGGGLVFSHPSTNKRYLRGVLSVAFKPNGVRGACFQQQYTTFTMTKARVLCKLIIPLLQAESGLPFSCGQI